MLKTVLKWMNPKAIAPFTALFAAIPTDYRRPTIALISRMKKLTSSKMEQHRSDLSVVSAGFY